MYYVLVGPHTIYGAVCILCQQWNLPDGAQYDVPQVPIGYATKKRKDRVLLSPHVKKYLEWAFSLGEKNKHLKLKPQTAATHMRLHGTPLGQQTYSASRFGWCLCMHLRIFVIALLIAMCVIC